MIRLPLYGEDHRAAVERADPLDRDPDCRRCPLGEQEFLRNRCLPADGAPGGLLIVGEGPGIEEDRSGRPFIGASGSYLRREIVKHWKGPVAYANATGCKPPRDGKERLLEKAVPACRGFLRQVIDEVKPTCVVALGSWAAYSVLGRAPAPLSVRGGYGWLWGGGRPAPVHLVMHPAAALRNRVYSQWFEADLKRALLREEPGPPPWGAECRVVESAADAAEAARELSRADAVWVSTDAETFGRMSDPGFRVFSVAACARGSDSPWVWPFEALEDSESRAHLQSVLDSVDNVAQNGKFDSQALHRGLGIDLPDHRIDTRLVRKLVDPDSQADLATMAELVGLGGHKEENAAEVKRAKEILVAWARQRPDGPRGGDAGETIDDMMARAWEREEDKRQTAERVRLRADGLQVPRLRRSVDGTAPPRWWTARPSWWTEDVRARLGEYRRDDRAISPENPEGWILDSAGNPKFFGGVSPEVYAYALVDCRVSQRYNALDTLTTARIAELEEQQMDEQPRVRKVWEVAVRPASGAIARVESNGVLVSLEQIQAFAGLLRLKLGSVWQRLAPYEVNPDSAPQLRELLFRKLGLPAINLTDTGLEATDRDALRDLRGQHPIIEDLLEWRRLTKLRGTYADGLRSHIQADGRVHTSLNIDGARTGRLSSNSPNMQNAPRAGSEEGRMFRDCFIAAPGHMLLEGDFSQLELRVAAMLSGDPEMRALFTSGADFHMQVARGMAQSVWRIRPEDVLDDHRSKAKTFVFGIIYGMSDQGIVDRTGCTIDEAISIRQSVMGRFSGLDRWIKEKIREAHRQSGAYTWWDGEPRFRFRPLPMLGDSDNGKRKHAENAAYNGPVQGTANEFCLQSLIALDRWLVQSGFPAKIVLTVHDSILFEVREDLVGDLALKMQEAMTRWPSDGVAMAVDFKLGKAWGSCDKYKPEPRAAAAAG